MPHLSLFARAVLFSAAAVSAKARLPTLPSDLTTPFQQRIAINGPDSIVVSWNTYAPLDTACVKYSAESCALNKRVCSTAPAQTYPSSRTWFHSVIIANLTVNTRYCYLVNSKNSSEAVFHSPRHPGDKTPFSINAVIDLGVYGEDGYTIKMDQTKRDAIPYIQPSLNHTTIQRLADTINDYELIIHPGDLGYADDWVYKAHNAFEGKKAYQAILEQFYDQLAPIASRRPYMASPGNHEAACQEMPYTTTLCPAGQKNFTDFMTRFGRSMPHAFASTSEDAQARINANRAKALANPPFWYSFEYGMAHIVMIDTETDFAGAPDGPDGSAGLNGGPFGAPGQQLRFLEADLASVDRSVTPWLIVAGHRPYYSCGHHPCEPCRRAFEALFYKYGVDLGVFGHVHNSQRFMPVFNGIPDPAGLDNPKAPMYIIAGGAGNVEGMSKIGERPSFNAFAYDVDFAYANLNFLDTENLQVTFRRSATGELLDNSTLRKSHNQQFVVQ